MDMQEPKGLQEYISYVKGHRMCADVSVQVKVLSKILEEIEKIYDLDRQLSASMDYDYSYESYDYYMSHMAAIAIGLIDLEPSLKRMFPTFYESSLYKLITAHISMIHRSNLIHLIEGNL